MDVATHLTPREDDPAVLCDNFNSVVGKIPRTNLANQDVTLSIGSTHKIFPPDGRDFDADHQPAGALVRPNQQWEGTRLVAAAAELRESSPRKFVT
jgi:hypothetical protein